MKKDIFLPIVLIVCAVVVSASVAFGVLVLVLYLQSLNSLSAFPTYILPLSIVFAVLNFVAIFLIVLYTIIRTRVNRF
ncbi:MAG: hypothetical protein FWD86_01325 [Firmicutes bacterium]|nr:hypothetical protein [Bacillota bacterium]